MCSTSLHRLPPPLLAPLVQLAAQVAGAVDRGEALRAIAAFTALLVAPDRLDIWAYGDDGLTWAWGHRRQGMALAPPRPDPATAKVAATGWMEWRTCEIAAAEAAATSTDVQTLLALPLVAPPGASTGLVGVITVARAGANAFSDTDVATMEAVAELAAAAMTNARLHADVRARAEALARLQEISLALNADLDPRRVVEHVVAAATQLTGALFSTVVLVDATGRLQHYLTDDPQADNQALHRPESFRPGGTTETVLRTGQPLVIEDATTDPRASPLVQARGLRAVIGLPLLVEGQVIGLLWVNFARPRRPTPDEMGILSTLAAQAATAVNNARLYAEARRLADRDAMTGLVNYRSLQEQLQYELAIAQRTGEPLSIVMIDLNDFKRVNDTGGHLAGDAALREVAAALTESCRERDTVGRYGGDEFLLLLPGTDSAGARAVAQRVAERVTSTQLPGAWVAIALNLAVGWATFPDEAADERALISLADRRMYAAKPVSPSAGARRRQAAMRRYQPPTCASLSRAVRPREAENDLGA